MSVFQYKHFNIRQDHAAMKVGTDSDLLGTMAAGGSRILDIGTGTGILSLMLAQRFPEAMVSAIEIDDNAILDASYNFAESPFSDRLTLHHISFQDYLLQRPDLQQRLSPESGNNSQQSLSPKSSNDSQQSISFPSSHNSNSSGLFDSVICNPPYFHQSLECPELGRTRARHSSSLPFDVLACGAYSLLSDGGFFSVCIPPEVLDEFTSECLAAGFSLHTTYQIKSLPQKPPKRYVLIFQKLSHSPLPDIHSPLTLTFCMRNADHTRSDWYIEQMREFLVMRNPRIL